MRTWRSALLLYLVSLYVPSATPCHAAPVRFARLKYGGGGDWYANPTAIPNLIAAVRQRTGIEVSPRADTVTLSDRWLAECAVVFATGHGRIAFSPAEAGALRHYLLHGGFLHVDDNYGLDESFRLAVRSVFPDRELVELPFDHPIYHCCYEFAAGLPKIHEHHGGPPHGYGILDQGRVVLFYSFNTDLNDGWESADVHQDPAALREAAIRMGVNVVTYALSH
jgi:hypothetical protein